MVKAKNKEQPPGIYRSSTDVWIGGVCGGIAKKLNIQSGVVRLIWTFLILTFGVGLLIYILLWIFIPLEKVSKK